ncbi:putative reverse transcriptase domain-containing protein [Tanacetum coccineum]
MVETLTITTFLFPSKKVLCAAISSGMKIVADVVAIALEAQAATMASASNPNRNTSPTRTPIPFNDIDGVLMKLSKHQNTLSKADLTLLESSFKIDLMPIKLGSFDVVIGMDWLSKYHAKFAMTEEVVSHSLSMVKLKSLEIKMLLRVMEKKSDEKRLEDILVVKEFSDVFPKDLLGLPSFRQARIPID